MKLVILSALVAAAAASAVSHVYVRRGEGLQSPYGPSGVDSYEYGVQHNGVPGYGGGISYRQRVGFGRTELGQEFHDPRTGSAAFVRSQGNLEPAVGHGFGPLGPGFGLPGGPLLPYGGLGPGLIH